ELSERRIGKLVRVEVVPAIGLGIQDLKRTGELRCVCPQEKQAANQLIVILSLNTDGEATLELDNPRKLPVVENLPGETLVFAHRKIPDIVDHKALLGVEQ